MNCKFVSLMAVACAFLTGCAAEQLEKLNRDLGTLNAVLAGANTSASQAPVGTMAVMPSSAQPSKNSQVQLVVPDDLRTQTNLEAALPTIKKVLSIHQCLKDGGMQQLNFYAVPGVDLAKNGLFELGWPNSSFYMKYHDRSKCVSVRAIDSVSMPALNALKLRVVFFAEDSGETVNFEYLYKQVSDSTWKLAGIVRVN